MKYLDIRIVFEIGFLVGGALFLISFIVSNFVNMFLSTFKQITKI